MTRVLYILFAFFFIIGNCLADADVCDDPNTTIGETDHNCSAGTYWDTSLGECKICPKGYYCPRQSNQNNGVAYCCPPPFTATQSAGVQNVKGCYIKIDTCIDGHQVVGIPEYPMDAVYIGCGENWSNRTCNAGFNTFTAQRAYSIHNGIYTRAAYENIHSGGLTYVDTFFDEGYHLEIQQSFSASPTHDYGGNVYPISFNIICVPNSMPCDTFRNFTDYEEADETFDIDNSTHVAQFNTALGAPPEDVEIGSVTIHGTNCPVGSAIQNNAVWDFDTETWDISQCICDRGNDQWMEDYSNNCMKNGRKIRHPKEQTPSDPITIIHSIYENVIFDTEDIIEDTSAVCRRCFPDVPNQSKYYYVPGPYGNNPGGFVDGHVTHCSSSPAKGYYRPSACSGDDVDWGEGALSANPCPREKCPLGQTTTAPMPIGNNQCKFGSLTQICDSAGCINLNTVGDLSLGDWQMLP